MIKNCINCKNGSDVCLKMADCIISKKRTMWQMDIKLLNDLSNEYAYKNTDELDDSKEYMRAVISKAYKDGFNKALEHNDYIENDMSKDETIFYLQSAFNLLREVWIKKDCTPEILVLQSVIKEMQSKSSL